MADEQLTWNDEDPTEPGWYWHKNEGEPAQAFHIVWYDGKFRTVHRESRHSLGETALSGFDGWTGKWAGPIEGPPTWDDKPDGS